MARVAALGGFVSLDDAESFAIEYWPLELYKLSLASAPRELQGAVALITGAAGASASAVARALVAEGACVVATDLDADGGGCVGRRAPSPRETAARLKRRSLRRRVGRGVLPGASAFFDRFEDDLRKRLRPEEHAPLTATRSSAREDVVCYGPERQGRLLDRRARCDARIRDDDVDTTEREHRGAVASMTDASSRRSRKRDRDVAELGGQRTRASASRSVADDAGAFCDKRARDCTADAPGRAGDQRDRSLQARAAPTRATSL